MATRMETQLSAASCSSIFSHDTHRARPSAPRATSMRAAEQDVTTHGASLDARLLAILDEPPLPRETVLARFTRIEAAMIAVFASLTTRDALDLHQRLVSSPPDDAIAERFGRLTVERRTRLVRFLANARRREAVANCRR